ncbi:hypothetical protein BST81_10230 [Leptolyngbya sp. 'hensonii']|uniref:ATP-binding protein n=1 Tax=Leptolyngbya sp. 'hensonii' TaxID=1922337 RepID=UPI00094F85C4|nr:ATP-binding protein [Leptolyngbya sp. 'hensonii']OLP18463.1 hypothetical protein BST81_10230 [Leptolyngbya sp. 'hensonii']
MTTLLPDHEVQRLKVLFSYGILDTPPEPAFDNLAILATQIFEAPISGLCFVDASRCWCKAQVGLSLFPLDREDCLCNQAILQPEPLILPDLLSEKWFSSSPLITHDPPIRFYASVPLIDPTGFPLGALVVMDYLPRELSPRSLEVLQGLGRQAMVLLEARRQLLVLSETIAASHPSLGTSQQATGEFQETSLARQIRVTLAQARLLSLEKQQRERLALQNLALEAARQQAEQESQIKSSFLATISHEVRTPMNAVLGVTDLLAETNLDPEQRDFLRIIRAGTNSLLTLINDILEFSKLESGGIKLGTSAFDLRVCMEEAVDLLAVSAYSKGLEIAAVLPDNVPTQLLGDVSRLRQILINLLGNAVKFTDQGEVLIRAALITDTETAVEIQFSVADTGIGIPIAAQSKLFQPFSQIKSSTPRKYGGTGLGLAISKQLAELMGGRIWVESDGVQGTEFLFTLTFQKQSTPVQTKSLALTEQAGLQGLRLLVVTAHVASREVIRLAIAGLGMALDEAEELATGLSWLEAAALNGHPYAIVILDYLALTSLQSEAGNWSRSTSVLARTPVLLMQSPIQRRKSGEPGLSRPEIPFAGYLTKPIKAAHLLACITRVMTGSHDGVVDCDRTPRPAPIAIELDSPLSGTLTQSATPPAGGPKILVVEDAPVNRMVVQQQLRSLGYTADLAVHGQEALNLMAQTDYDLVLMDCQMPVLDGYETVCILRQQERPGRHTIVIAMTANALMGDREKCLGAGMDDYLSKPLSREDLATKLQQWLTSPPAQDPPPSQTSGAVHTEAEGSAPELAPPPAVNWPHLQTISEGDEAFALELLTLFLQDHWPYLDLLRLAMARQDYPEIKRLAHRFKGASANLGASVIQDLVADIEQRIVNNRTEKVPDLLMKLEELMSQIRDFLAAKNSILGA